MNSIKWEEFQGKRIALLDYGNATGQKLVEQIEYFVKMLMTAAPDNSRSLLVLHDVRNVTMDKASVDSWKASAVKVKSRCSKTAVLGIVGIRKVLFHTITSFSGIDAKIFDSKEESLAWLIDD